MITRELLKGKFSKVDHVKAYSLVIALLPVISIYASGIPGVNFGELLLMFFCVYSFIIRKGHYNRRQASIVIIFGAYVILSTIIAMLLDASQIVDVLIRSIRFIFYLFVIISLSHRSFDSELAKGLIKYVSVVATVYIVIQVIFYQGFRIVLKGFLPFVPLYTTSYENIDYAAAYTTFFHRPTSFFLEPAHYSQYVLVGLAICLFREKINFKNILIALFLTLGIIVSTSGLGLLIAGFVWIVFILYLIIDIKQATSRRKVGIILSAAALVSGLLVINSQVLRNTLSRIITSGPSTAISARGEGFAAFLSEKSVYNVLFGAGFGNTPPNVWFSGIAYILFCSGIVGFLLLAAIYGKYLIKSRNMIDRMIIIVCFLLAWTSEMINSYWIVFMFSLICYANRSTGPETEAIINIKTPDVSGLI